MGPPVRWSGGEGFFFLLVCLFLLQEIIIFAAPRIIQLWISLYDDVYIDACTVHVLISEL